MATGTIFRGGNVINGFAHRCHTIVAGRAVAYDTGMAKRRIEEAAGDVTNTAILGRRYMVDRLTTCSHAIVTGGTVVYYAGMVKYCGGKGGGAMAVGAVRGGGYMRRWFASCH